MISQKDRTELEERGLTADYQHLKGKQRRPRGEGGEAVRDGRPGESEATPSPHSRAAGPNGAEED